MFCREPPHSLAGAQDAAGDIHRHHPRDTLGRHFIDAQRRSDDAGIVDQSAERSEAIGGLEQCENVLLAADVAFHRDRLAIAGLDLRDDLVRSRLIAGIADDDTKATLGGFERRGATNTAASAGDDND